MIQELRGRHLQCADIEGAALDIQLVALGSIVDVFGFDFQLLFTGLAHPVSTTALPRQESMFHKGR